MSTDEARRQEFERPGPNFTSSCYPYVLSAEAMAAKRLLSFGLPTRRQESKMSERRASSFYPKDRESMGEEERIWKHRYKLGHQERIRK